MRVKQVYAHYERVEQPTDGFKLCPFCGTQLVLAESGHKLRPTCPGCGFVQHWDPAPTVSILIVDGDRVLLGKRGGAPGKGTWSVPSGYIEYEDDFLTTAVREAKQETGLDIEVSSIVNVVSSFVSPRFHFLGVYVVTRVVGGELAAGDDLEAAEWFPIAGPLPHMGFQEDVDIIEMVANGYTGLPVDPDYARPTPRETDIKEYTRKQGQYLAFIHYYTRLNRIPPAETDIQRYFRVSPPTVHQMILRLEERGLITRIPGRARTIEVAIPPEQLPPLE